MKLTGSHGTTTTLGLAFLASLFLTAALSAQAPAQFTVVDLTPGGQVVGYGSGNGASGSFSKALYWADAHAPALDLNQFLPAGLTDAVASGIDANGRIIGTAWSNGGLAEEQSASERAIVLVPVR